MKCERPAFASVSSREPALTQYPIATERACSSRSEITRSPESSAVSVQLSTAGSYAAPPPRTPAPTLTALLGGVSAGLGVAALVSLPGVDPALRVDPRTRVVYRAE